MAPRLEFLGYFIVLLVGISSYLVESHRPTILFVAVIAAHLVALRYLCSQMTRRFKYDGERKKAA